MPLSTPTGFVQHKTKLEDLGLKYTEPAVYNDIVSKIKKQKKTRCLYWDISTVLKTSLDLKV
jgi:GTP pyrophosphokinase